MGCKALTPDFDAIIAIEVVVPDSGRLEVGDTLRPRARAINGRGDSTAATFVWSALDTTLQVVDSVSGLTLGRFVGAGRPVDGGRGRTWDGRWRRLVIELHCRTPDGMGRPRRASPRCTLAR